MSRFLDWLDEAAGGLIRIAYLAWGITAVWTYFGEGWIAFAVSVAVELHMYLSARRVRQAWQEKRWDALKINLGILGFLILFSVLNQFQYLGETWHPPITPLSLPGLWAYIVRALVVPAAFMAAAFLAPVGSSLPAQVRAEAHRVAQSTFRVARKQWRARLRQMRRSGQDVTMALVQLVEDPDEQRIIATIHAAMYPEIPPTGPGTPVANPDTNPDTFDIPWEDAPRVPPRLITRRLTPADRRALRKRAEAVARRAAAFDALDLDPTLSKKAVRERLGCAQTTANMLYSAWQQSREREEVAQ